MGGDGKRVILGLLKVDGRCLGLELAFYPRPLDFTPIRLVDNTIPVLLPVTPVSFIPGLIRPSEDAIPMLLVINILPLIHTSIRPSELPLPMHLILLPGTFVLPLGLPLVRPNPIDVVIDKIPLVFRPIRPEELTVPVLDPIFVLPAVVGAVSPLFKSITVLLVVCPVTFVNGSGEVVVLTESMRLVV
jgi:hypothetical protein